MKATVLPPSEIPVFLPQGWVFLFSHLQPACTRLLWCRPNSGLHAASTDRRWEQKGKTSEGKEGSGSIGVREVGWKGTIIPCSLLFPFLWPTLVTVWPQAWKRTAQAMPLQGGSLYGHTWTLVNARSLPCLEVVVIDGKSGLPVWNQELPWQKQQLDALSVMTLDKKSVFLFWADEAQPVLQSLVSKHPFFTLRHVQSLSYIPNVIEL